MPELNGTLRFSTMDWKSQCQIADASDRMDTAQDGLAKALALRDDEVAYCFSNGRKFRGKPDPYV